MPPGEHEDIKRRAVRGVALVFGRGLVVRAMAFVGLVLLARLLTPQDFGVLAVGFSLLAVGTLLADGGLGAGLVRREAAPRREELRSLLGLQLVLAFVAAAVVTALAPVWGPAGWAVAVMVWSLPLSVLQGPGAILLERDMAYGPRVSVELAETATYYTGAVLLAWSGHGLVAVACMSVVRGVVGALVMWRVGPVGPLRPMLSMDQVRHLLGFGVRFQGINVLNMVRDQGLNLGIAAIAGVATLGLWSLAFRVMQPPFVILESLWRVSFPAVARLREAGGDITRPLRSTLQVSVLLLALVLTPIAVTSSILIVVVFGPEWEESAVVLPFACLALLLAGPVSVTAAGVASANGELGVLLRAAAATAVVWLATAFALLPSLGLVAVGLGWLLGSLADMVVLWRYLSRIGVAVLPVVWRVTSVAQVVGVLGMILMQDATPRLSTLVLAASATVATVALAVVLVDRGAVGVARATVRRLRPQGGTGA